MCILWHPARKLFDEITENLNLFGRIVKTSDLSLSEHDYIYYTRGIYHVDDIENWKVEKKIKCMLSDKSGCYQIRVICMEIDYPDYRIKESTQRTLSRKCESIKSLIRNAYKNKIDNYIHDIIIHIGDNIYQNRSIYRLMTMPILNMEMIINHICDCKYVIIKYDTPYMPKDFPVHYALGKDLDIICADEIEYDKVLSSIMNDIKSYESDYCIRIVSIKDEKGWNYRTLVRLEQEDQLLVFLFDVAMLHQTGRDSLDFTRNMLDSRKQINVFFVPSVPYEIIVRLSEYKKNNNKIHHLEYVKNHYSEIDENLCDKYLDFNWKKLIK